MHAESLPKLWFPPTVSCPYSQTGVNPELLFGKETGIVSICFWTLVLALELSVFKEPCSCCSKSSQNIGDKKKL